jgi:HlyD family secretion protein
VRRLSLFVLLVVLALGLGYAGLAAVAGIRGAGAPTYFTATVERGDIVTTVTASGTVDAVVTIEVGSQLSGQIAEVFVDFNDEVNADQPLARLDPQGFAAKVAESRAALQVAEAVHAARVGALARARANLANAEATVAVMQARSDSARALFEDAERDLARKQKLVKRGAVSKSDRDSAATLRKAAAADLKEAEAQEAVHATQILRAKAELDMAEAAVVEALAGIAENKAALTNDEVELERTLIRAPIDGVVIKRDIDEGQTVAASLEAPTLFTIAQDLSDMRVETSVDEADIGRILHGQEVEFTVDSYPDRSFTGQVIQIRKAPVYYRNVVTYTVIVSTENPDLALLPGMTANVEIVVDEAADVLKVPNAALRFTPPELPEETLAGDSGHALVWVLDRDGTPVPIPLRIGVGDNRVSEVVEGPLEEGQEVIVSVTLPESDSAAFGLHLGF